MNRAPPVVTDTLICRLPVDRACLVDALRHVMWLRDNENREFYLLFSPSAQQLFCNCLSRDECPDIDERVKAFFEHPFLGFPLRGDSKEELPLMTVVETSYKGDGATTHESIRKFALVTPTREAIEDFYHRGKEGWIHA